MKIINEKYLFMILLLGILIISNVFSKSSHKKIGKNVFSNANLKIKTNINIPKAGNNYIVY